MREYIGLLFAVTVFLLAWAGSAKRDAQWGGRQRDQSPVSVMAIRS